MAECVEIPERPDIPPEGMEIADKGSHGQEMLLTVA